MNKEILVRHRTKKGEGKFYDFILFFLGNILVLSSIGGKEGKLLISTNIWNRDCGVRIALPSCCVLRIQN